MSDVTLSYTTTPPQTSASGVPAASATAPQTSSTGIGAASATQPQTGATGIGTASVATPQTAATGFGAASNQGPQTGANPLAHFTAPLPTMPSSFKPGFVELTGQVNSLDTLTATTTDVGTIITGTVGGAVKNYRVAAGTDAQALPGIVHPANYDASTNAFVFVEC